MARAEFSRAVWGQMVPAITADKALQKCCCHFHRGDPFLAAFINKFLMLCGFVFIIHKDLNAAFSGLVSSEDNSLLLRAVNPITLLGQGGVFCANIFGRSEKNYSVWLTQRGSIFQNFSADQKVQKFLHALEETWLKELSAFNFDHKTVAYLKYKGISQWKVVSNQKINHYLKSSEKFFDVGEKVELCKP